MRLHRYGRQVGKPLASEDMASGRLSRSAALVAPALIVGGPNAAAAESISLSPATGAAGSSFAVIETGFLPPPHDTNAFVPGCNNNPDIGPDTLNIIWDPSGSDLTLGQFPIPDSSTETLGPLTVPAVAPGVYTVEAECAVRDEDPEIGDGHLHGTQAGRATAVDHHHYHHGAGPGHDHDVEHHAPGPPGDPADPTDPADPAAPRQWSRPRRPGRSHTIPVPPTTPSATTSTTMPLQPATTITTPPTPRSHHAPKPKPGSVPARRPCPRRAGARESAAGPGHRVAGPAGQR